MNGKRKGVEFVAERGFNRSNVLGTSFYLERPLPLTLPNLLGVFQFTYNIKFPQYFGPKGRDATLGRVEELICVLVAARCCLMKTRKLKFNDNLFDEEGEN